jgi:hypothetical protein
MFGDAHEIADQMMHLRKERDALAAELDVIKRTREQERDYANICYDLEQAKDRIRALETERNAFQDQCIVRERRQRALEADLAESTHHRDKNHDTAVALQARVSALEAALRGVVDRQAHRGTVVLYEEDIDGLRALLTPETTVSPAVDLNLEPIGQCDRCRRKVWKSATLGEIDEIKQPDGSICGGRFQPL